MFRWLAIPLTMLVMATSIPMFPTHVDASFEKHQIVEAQRLLEDWKRQEAYYKKQLKMYPGNQDLQRKLIRVQQAIRNLENQLRGK
jgi:hypothetical protein